MGTYQAVYDAVRSRMTNGDIGGAVRDVAWQHFDISHLKEHGQQALYQVANEWSRPSVVFKPTLSADGNMWCALLGDDLQEGIAGFGETPAEAMAAFDQNFLKGKTPAAMRAASGIEAPSGGETTKIGSTEGESPTRQGDAQSQPLGNPLDTGDGK